MCNVFYVCTSHFVVMFIGSSGSGVTKQSCNAYISQSTRGLRSLLKEHMRCVETKRVEDMAAYPGDNKHGDGESFVLGSSIAITDDAYIPSCVCALIGSEGKSFEARHAMFIRQQSPSIIHDLGISGISGQLSQAIGS